MGTSTTNQSGSQSTSNNTGYNMGQALQMRLDTNPLLQSLREFLSGTRLIVNKRGDDIVTELVPMGSPRLNQRGVQALMSRLTLLLSTAVVQGNYTEERYSLEIYTIRKSLAKEMMNNLYAWEINENEYSGIIDAIMTTVKAYLSRLIGNKERESYDATLKVIESSQLQQKGRLPI